MLLQLEGEQYNMEEKMMDLYRKLSLENQRNEFSSLLMKMDSLLNVLIEKKNLQDINKVKNYDVNSDSNLSEQEVLAFFYEDIWILKNKILMLLTIANHE